MQPIADPATDNSSYDGIEDDGSSEKKVPARTKCCIFDRDGGLESSEIRVSRKRNADSISSILSSQLSQVHVEVEQNKDDLEKMWAATFARVRGYHKRCHKSRRKKVI